MSLRAQRSGNKLCFNDSALSTHMWERERLEMDTVLGREPGGSGGGL